MQSRRHREVDHKEADFCKKCENARTVEVSACEDTSAHVCFAGTKLVACDVCSSVKITEEP